MVEVTVVVDVTGSVVVVVGSTVVEVELVVVGTDVEVVVGMLDEVVVGTIDGVVVVGIGLGVAGLGAADEDEVVVGQHSFLQLHGNVEQRIRFVHGVEQRTDDTAEDSRSGVPIAVDAVPEARNPLP